MGGQSRCLFTICGSLAASTYLWNRQKYRRNPYLGLARLSAEEPVVVGRKAKVLIVGAGLTGCLTSYLLRKQFGDSINLQVVERSAYPSGRFGAGLRYDTSREGESKWADMGSQVVCHSFTLTCFPGSNLKILFRCCLPSTAMVTIPMPGWTGMGCLPRISFRHQSLLSKTKRGKARGSA